MTTVTGNSHAAIFRRLIESDQECLPRELAQHLLRLRFPQQDQERVNELASKAREGSLNAEERDELDGYNLVGDVLAVWQSKARRSLNRQ
jgi:hypothetical protein